MRIMRAVDVTRNGGQSVIFNDPITGGRSFKAWGWSQADYDAAAVVLKRNGYQVKQVITADRERRLWVYA
jgi:hypothetical protein